MGSVSFRSGDANQPVGQALREQLGDGNDFPRLDRGDFLLKLLQSVS